MWIVLRNSAGELDRVAVPYSQIRLSEFASRFLVHGEWLLEPGDTITVEAIQPGEED